MENHSQISVRTLFCCQATLVIDSST